MDKQTIYVTAGIIVLGALLGGGFYAMLSPKAESPALGLSLVSSITNTSSSIGMTDTVINSPSNFQYLRVSNSGNGLAFCGFNTTSTVSTAISATDSGIRLNPVGSSTLVSFETYDPNFLSKYLHCKGDTTSTVNILKY